VFYFIRFPKYLFFTIDELRDFESKRGKGVVFHSVPFPIGWLSRQRLAELRCPSI